MESAEELSNSIKQYELQLSKVTTALIGASEDEKAQLLSLKANITELLELTKQSLDALTPDQDQPCLPEPEDDDPFAREYAMFKAELENLEHQDGENSNSNHAEQSVDEADIVDIQDELEELVGSKCQAPYTNKLNVTDYFNALVFSSHVPDMPSDFTQIQVRVMFINPTEKDMIPCPFYLDGKCKFSDGKCNFSHGYLVPFSQLREYKEPEFGLIKRGCHVLAKPPGNQTWVSTRVEDVVSNDTVSIKYHGVVVHVPLHDIFPLTSEQDGNYISDEEVDEPDNDAVCPFGEVSEAAVERSLMDPLGSNRKFGEWEQHTKGIGSKLMAKMGYVVGAGLGKSGEGRIEPVQAMILPPGKSLDHCMNLKEAAGGSKDLFSVERLQKKLALQAQRKSARMYNKKKKEEQHNVFNLINNMSSVSKKSDGKEFLSRSFKKQLESSSERSLNIEKLKTEETMERMSRDIYILNDKLSMKKEGSVEYNHIAAKLSAARSELESLQKKNGKIAWEINIRNPIDETECVECPKGTAPDSRHELCLEIPEVFLRAESGWAIGAMTLSSLGILLTVFVASVFLSYNRTPVVKAAGRELSYILLSGILLCYTITFILVLRPTDTVCALQRLFWFSTFLLRYFKNHQHQDYLVLNYKYKYIRTAIQC